MPELPEVEVCRRQLDRWASGRRIGHVRVEDPAVFRSVLSTRPSAAVPDGNALGRRLAGQVPLPPVRHGKRIGWLVGSQPLLVHLGMTGKWLRRPGHEPAPRFARLGLQLEGDETLWFADARRFGCLVPVSDLDAELRVRHGPDALLEAPGGVALQERFQTSTAIKVALLDQTRLAGLGNIHAAEALWRARIHPGTPARGVAPDAWERLAGAIVRQLRESIDDSDGDEIAYMTDGGVENPFAVYGRAGEPCRRCETAVHREVMGGRATFWCPGCQPA